MDPVEAAQRLRKDVDGLTFQPPVETIYNPLDYAWDGHRKYLEAFATGPRKVLMVGMNPGPWGMGQTGVPFGDVDMVGTEMGLDDIEVDQPQHPIEKRPVDGLACERNEVSGTRLYTGLMAAFGTLPQAFEHLFVANHTPLLFFDEDGKNLTPPRLRKADREALFEVCDAHLATLIDFFRPATLVGIGKFAERRAKAALGLTDREAEVTYLLHPSPANPQANKEGGAYWQRQFLEVLTGAELPVETA